ncbi:MAG TPA: 3'(2'),5'-bisphosphate nucleotidase CysQ [Aestuariivirgaceae bacterium]|nr:3'(2'),5'-bisphosphate nucleotidase CysQ [Aestuariivirgaceae bacterium]
MRGLVDLALAAGEAVMAVYAGAPPAARLKADSSPVTEADLRSEAVILEGLRRLAPAIPVISEESAASTAPSVAADRFFLVDPLDGTREFLGRNGEFTVNIALIEARSPVAGVIFAPAIERLFWAEQNLGAFEADVSGTSLCAISKRRLRTAQPGTDLRVVASRSHLDPKTEAWLKARSVASLVSAGSSLKFCLVAAGEADAYPRFGRTMEWDTAAGHAILEAAGGRVAAADGGPLLYGKREAGFANGGFIATGA